MYRLYGAPGRASAAPEAVLEELGVPYEYVEVDADQRRGPEYRKLNPLGQVPTLVDGDRVIWESAAICMYLCDQHPAAGLAPALDSPHRGPYYQWLVFLSNTLQPAYMSFIYPDRFCDDAHGATRVKDAAARKVAELWQAIEDALVPGPFLLGERVSACDLYLHMLGEWQHDVIVKLSRYARVTRLLELVEKRPGVQRMLLRNA